MPTTATEPAATTTATTRLLERSAHLEALRDLADRARTDVRGRLALIAGEAGIGKTTLVREFAATHRDTRVLAGACDALHTPRPLGPLLDIADEAGGSLAKLAANGATPSALVAALTDELKTRHRHRHRPTVLILEDLHWADGATLDVLRLLARRLDTLPALVLATYRDDELDRSHPLRMLLGELPRRTAHRITLKPLSPDAVATLAAQAHRADHAELHEKTAGNPFFVTEVLAAADQGDVPDTVRDAVLARAARLDPEARTLLDAVAILPHRAELWLLDKLTDGDLSALDACLASGILRAARQAVAFRHEIARVAIEDSLAPHTRSRLHKRALTALAEPPGSPDFSTSYRAAKNLSPLQIPYKSKIVFLLACLPYKQEVRGSSPRPPTILRQITGRE